MIQRVVIVYSSPIFRTGLRSLLSAGIEVVVDTDSPLVAFHWLRHNPMVQVHGAMFELELLFRSEECGWPWPIMAFCQQPTEAQVDRAVARGVKGFLPSHAIVEEVLAGLKAIMAGDTYVHSTLTHHFVGRLRRHARGRPDLPGCVRLTSREESVLALVREGYAPPQIALELSITTFTVKTHLHSLYRKFRVNSRHQLLLKFVSPKSEQ